MSSSTSKVNIDFVTQYVGRGNVQNAHKDIAGLGDSVKKLAGAFGLAFGGAELARFGKDAVAAFAADDKSAKILTNTLSNLGLAFNNLPVENFITKLSELNGMTKTDLRTAFDTLVRQTLDATKAQNLLNLALDVSKGTGKDLATVSTAISKAYGGTYTALSKLGAGLTKADIASKNFDLMAKKLAATFKGDAAVAAETYAGKIDRLKTSFEEFKITIGSGIVDAFSLATSNGGSIDKFQKGMSQTATNISDTVRGVGVLLGYIDDANAKLAQSTGFSWGKAIKTALGFAFGTAELQTLGAKAKAATVRLAAGTANQQFDKAMADMAKLKAAQDKLAKEAAAQAKAALVAANAIKKAAADKLALERAALSLKLAGATTDMQNIEIQAALQRGQTQQVNDVLLLQRAILNDNADQANLLAQRVLKANGLVMDVNGNISSLAGAKDPFQDWPAASDAARAELKKIEDALALLKDKTITITVNTVYTQSGGSGSSSGAPKLPPGASISPGGNNNTGNGRGGTTDYSNYVGSPIVSTVFPDASAVPSLPSLTDLYTQSGTAPSSTGLTPVNVTVLLDGTVVSNAVQQTMVNNTASGTPTTFARSQGAQVGDW